MSRLAAVVFIAMLLFSSLAFAQNDKIYDRIMKTQTIRCGYAEWPPFMAIDPNTQQISGMMHDVWEMIGTKLGLKIKWETAIGWGEITEALNSGKVDMFCLAMWPDAGRLKNLLVSRPMFYNPTYLYGRADDKRFDGRYETLNDPKYTVIGQEGDITATVLAMKFPKAKSANIAPMDQQGNMIINVTSGKGDVTLLDVPYAEEYMKSNPGKIRQVKGLPVTIMQSVIPIARGENQLKSMMDAVITDLVNDGTLAGLIQKYEAKETYPAEPDVKIPVK